MTVPRTIAELRAAGYPDRSVKEEMRHNLIERLRSGRELFPQIIGYEDSVIPSFERALLAGHDVILLGERGQAKSRLIRSLVGLLDGKIPIVEGCEINDHPYRPICARCRDLVAQEGDHTPIAWIGRDLRYAEKLATPDTAVADLIGDVDPIRVAEGRYLGDELTIHFGLVPRTNRGIVAINELPDLPERIQVALLNILEERDVQVRGYKIRLPLDLMLIATANPEDYTHRGRIITPLKDRFGSQIRTHYPQTIEDEIEIIEQEATPPPDVRCRYACRTSSRGHRGAHRPAPRQPAREPAQRSVRAVLDRRARSAGASALRRALTNGEDEAIPRVVDLWAILPACIGRVEFDTLEEGREADIIGRALKEAARGVAPPARRPGLRPLRPLRRRARGQDLRRDAPRTAADAARSRAFWKEPQLSGSASEESPRRRLRARVRARGSSSHVAASTRTPRRRRLAALTTESRRS